jgi:gas vesicle protein
MKIEVILTIVGLIIAFSGFNIANAINSFVKNRIDLIKELNAIREGCKDETNKLEKLARQKINRIIGAIKSLSSQQHQITEKHNEIAETVFQIQSFLELHHQFSIKKKSPDTISTLNPFDSLEIDFEITEQGDLTK